MEKGEKSVKNIDKENQSVNLYSLGSQLFDIMKQGELKWQKPWTVTETSADKISTPAYNRVHKPIKSCEEIIMNMPDCPKIIHGSNRAGYQNASDTIHMPDPETFQDSQSYYSTLFHELIHSTGHKNRLNRPAVQTPRYFFDFTVQTKEQLTAELGACYLLMKSGMKIKHLKNHAAYIQHQLLSIKYLEYDEKKIITHACTKAQQAGDWILNTREKEMGLDERTRNISKRYSDLEKIRRMRTNEKSLGKSL
jgi:antirestriction protein ArdC